MRLRGNLLISFEAYLTSLFVAQIPSRRMVERLVMT
jgi:hypothetical protein